MPCMSQMAGGLLDETEHSNIEHGLPTHFSENSDLSRCFGTVVNDCRCVKGAM